MGILSYSQCGTIWTLVCLTPNIYGEHWLCSICHCFICFFNGEWCVFLQVFYFSHLFWELSPCGLPVRAYQFAWIFFFFFLALLWIVTATLSVFSGKGIIGLYDSFVLVPSQFVRPFFSNLASKIMFEDLPNVDSILQLCLYIYLVRESGELYLEEDLSANLVFLYRSPENLIEWTVHIFLNLGEYFVWSIVLVLSIVQRMSSCILSWKVRRAASDEPASTTAIFDLLFVI